MYPYDFLERPKPIDFKQIFVAMPFGTEYKHIFTDLIEPATDEANHLLERTENNRLSAVRTMDNPRTNAGWLEVLENLNKSIIVLGVLTGNNPNVFYELGIAHSTQPLTRQILIAEEEYESPFDLQGLIHVKYNPKNLSEKISRLAGCMYETINGYSVYKSRRVKRARMQITVKELEIMWKLGEVTHFVKSEVEGYDFDIANLCRIGLLGFNTEAERGSVEYAYWWTSLGNEVLVTLERISEEECNQRRLGLPTGFD